MDIDGQIISLVAGDGLFIPPGAARMAGLELNKAMVWTLEDLIQSRCFYEKNGALVVGSGRCKIGGHELVEVAYGWGQ